MFKWFKIVFVLLILIGISLVGYKVYSIYYLPVTTQDSVYKFNVDKGETMRVVAEKLAKDGVVQDSSAIVIFNQFNPVDNLQSGEFAINLPATPSQIITQIQLQNQVKVQEIQSASKAQIIQITFNEGNTLDDIIAKIAEKGIFTKELLSQYAMVPTNFDQTKYTFLPPALDCQYGEISNCAKYYIEGYMYPDTYSFYKDVTIDQIFTKFLDNFQVKVWDTLTPKPDSAVFHKTVIMASVIEKETGRPIEGINSTNFEEVREERKNVASVLINRNLSGQKWESNPTVAYWSDSKVCEQTIVIKNCVYLDSPEAQNLYNTYNNVGYPIGAISSPSLDSINATLNPNQTEYYYFLAENSGKTYFARTADEHEENITMVKRINNQS